MNVTLDPNIQTRIDEKLRRGEFESAEALFEQALTFFLDYEEVEPDEDEIRDTQVALDEALVQGERGEGRPAEQVFVALRASSDTSAATV